MPCPRIVIAGVGLITPIGHSAWQTFSALLAGRTVTDRGAKLSDAISPIDLVRAIGCVSVVQHTTSDPSIDLAERAARDALADAGVAPAPGGMSAIIGTSKGAMHAMTAALARPLSVERQRRLIPARIAPAITPDAALAVTLGPHEYLCHHLRRRLLLDQTHHFVAACASSLTALHQARLRLLHTGGRLLVITSEATLLPAFIHSYQRLGVLPPLNRQHYRCLPLDHHRCGFTLTELGAAVVLEATDAVSPGQIELVDTAIGAEAHDLVRPSPYMAALSHVAEQLFTGRRIAALHPHASATFDHDPGELTAYQKPLAASLSPTALPHLYAVKGALGHGLGASGLVSLVVACLCAKTDRLPPMPWLTHPILPIPDAQTIRSGDHHAVFAAGFAGHVAGALIKKVTAT